MVIGSSTREVDKCRVRKREQELLVVEALVKPLPDIKGPGPEIAPCKWHVGEAKIHQGASCHHTL